MPAKVKKALRHVLEVDIEDWVVAEAKKRGIRSLKLGHKYDTGWPDRQFFVPGGKPLFIEFKRPGDEPRPKQEYMHGVLLTLGYQVEVHDDRDRALSSILAAVDATRRPKKGRKISS